MRIIKPYNRSYSSLILTACIFLSWPSAGIAAGLGEHRMQWPSLEDLFLRLTGADRPAEGDPEGKG